jgi:hypothetical protein
VVTFLKISLVSRKKNYKFKLLENVKKPPSVPFLDISDHKFLLSSKPHQHPVKIELDLRYTFTMFSERERG